MILERVLFIFANEFVSMVRHRDEVVDENASKSFKNNCKAI